MGRKRFQEEVVSGVAMRNEDETEKYIGFQVIANNPGERSFSGVLRCESHSRWAEK